MPLNTRHVTIGEITYNGYTFPGALKQSVRCKPMYDRGDTYVKFTTYTLKIEFILLGEDIGVAFQTTDPAPGDDIETTDGVMDQLRAVIMQSGKKLVIKRKGDGQDVTVNGTPTAGRMGGVTEQWDADMGPKPRILEWLPVGNNQAIKVVWEIEYSLVECDVYYLPGSGVSPVEITYGINWSINDRGLTTRSVSGEIEIPVRRDGLTSSIKLQDVSDEYRDWIKNVVSIPPGFVRNQEYRMSNDRKFLIFSIQDSEIESDEPYFPGCLSIEASHRTHSSMTGGPFGNSAFNVWVSTMDVSITVKKGFSKCHAYEVFLLLIAMKTALVPGVSMVSSGSHIAGSTAGSPHWMPWEIDVQDDIFSRNIRCSFTWLLFSGLSGWHLVSRKTTCEADPYKNQALFEPIAGKSARGADIAAPTGDKWPDDFDPWTSDMHEDAPEPGPFNQRGYRVGDPVSFAGVNTYKLWDPCQNSGKDFYNFQYGSTGYGLGNVQDTGDVVKLHVPQPKNSLLGYTNSYTISQNTQVLQHRKRSGSGDSNRIQVVELVSTEGVTGRQDQQGEDWGAQTYNPVKNPMGDKDDRTAPKMQVTGPTSYQVVVVGSALSAFWTMDPPLTQKWGDAVLYLQNKVTSVEELQSGQMPLYKTSWTAVYSASQSPTNYPIQLDAEEDAIKGKFSETSKTTAIPTFNTRGEHGAKDDRLWENA